MPIKRVAEFGAEHLSVLNEEGEADKELMPEISEDQMKVMYHYMVLARRFDEKLFKLQRQGKIGTYAQLKGQEAAQIGSAMALNKEDWFVPSFREMGVYLVRGADRAKIVQAWMGDTRAFEGDAQSRNLPVSIPIASQIPHAVGIAWASKLKKENSATIVYFGDGATSEGDFHEGMNFAGVLNLPVVFFCQNNQWAISTPRRKQTASQTIAQKAIAYGFRGVQVDGNDVLAVYKAAKEALERARKGEGPTLIEAVTYRLGDHTTSDDASKYRSKEEVEEWEKKDPIERLKKHFQKIGTWSDDYEKWVEEEVEKEIADAVEKAFAIPPPQPENLFKNVFAEPPPDFQKELESLKNEVEQGRGDSK